MPLKRPFPPKSSGGSDSKKDDKEANLPPWLRKKKPVKK